MDEKYYEKLLNINTTGEKLWDNTITHYHPYQATAYFALEILFKQYNLTNNDYIVDFGCGKGRLNFYINYFFDANVVGIEMDNNYFKDCLINKENYLKYHNKKASTIDFKCSLAQDYVIRPEENKFYFFNPFSIQIFRKIIKNILSSLDTHERKIQLILYYPSEDYIYFLENNTSFLLLDEIPLDELYFYDINERFLIYELNYSCI
ncbi:MAG: methyltransferase [Romboutsia sp.]